jgi:hypothetical protein
MTLTSLIGNARRWIDQGQLHDAYTSADTLANGVLELLRDQDSLPLADTWLFDSEDCMDVVNRVKYQLRKGRLTKDLCRLLASEILRAADDAEVSP